MAKKTLDVISAKEFEDFKKSTEDTQNKMLNLLENLSQPKPEQRQINLAVQATQNEINSEKDAIANGFLPPQYQRVFEKYFDPKDGFEARLNFPEMDEQGREMGGITFTIIVPTKFSNVSDAHKKFYKVDMRLVALRPENIVRGIEAWCSKVSKNIRYNKNLKTK